jgi:lipopolysaccharide transport system permease protein
VTRIYFPRVYFPAAVALSSMVDFFFSFVALLVLMFVFGFVPGVTVLALPMILVVVYAASMGLALFFSALNVSYRDVGVLVPFVTQVGFFLSPIIYPASIVPLEFHTIYFANPFALGIETFRWALFGTPAPPIEGMLLGSVVAVLMLFGGYVFFRQREGTFADVI